MEERFRDWSMRFSWRDEPKSAFHGFTIQEDEATVRRAMRFLMNCQSPPKFHEESKDETYAAELIMLGHKLVRRKTWKIILESYIQASMFAPPNSPLLARCHFYCSVALFLGKLYKEGSLHADRAIAIGPPDDLKSKVYICKARCIYEMNGRRRCPEVQEAILNAHIWLGSMDESDIGRADVISSINFLNRTPLLEERMEADHDQNEEPTIPDDNEKIKQASSAIEIKFNDENGRYIAASRDIRAGELLFAHKSYASVIYSRMQNEICWHCSKHILAGVPCNQCPMVLFCSENCRDMAWNEYHDLECLAVSAMLEVDMDANEIMTMRLLIKAYKEADCSIDKLRAKLIALQSIEDPIEKLYTDGRFDNMKYASIFSLTRRFPVVSTHAARAIVILLFLAGTTNIFGQKIRDYLGLLQTEGTKFMACLIMRHIGICYNNAVGELEKDTSYGVCLQVNSLLSLFNHSCDPSVLVYTHGDVKYCIAIKNILRGEQIYRCYLPDDWIMNLSKRKTFLLESFNFNCECNACQNNWRYSVRRYPPSHVLRNYPVDVINQWNLITHNFPLENDTYSTNLPLYSKFFQ